MRYSVQRQEVYNSVMNSSNHPDAMMIYNDVKVKIPNISLGTIYRNLNELSEKGEIKKIHMADGTDRFDKTLFTHNHIICESCGKVEDIEIKINDSDIKKIEKETCFKITNCDFNISGLCNDCIKERKN